MYKDLYYYSWSLDGLGAKEFPGANICSFYMIYLETNNHLPTWGNNGIGNPQFV